MNCHKHPRECLCLWGPEGAFSLPVWITGQEQEQSYKEGSLALWVNFTSFLGSLISRWAKRTLIELKKLK